MHQRFHVISSRAARHCLSIPYLRQTRLQGAEYRDAMLTVRRTSAIALGPFVVPALYVCGKLVKSVSPVNLFTL